MADPRVLGADAARVAVDDDRIHEVSPELSFAAMNDGAPLADRKKCWTGARHRLDLLADEGIDVPADVGAAGRALQLRI